MKGVSVLLLAATLSVTLVVDVATAQNTCDVTVQCRYTPPPGFQATPLSDWTSQTAPYLGKFQGYLYNGSNSMLPAHDSDGKAAAARIQPLDVNGRPSKHGKIVFLSIGMSNNDIEFCGGASFDSNGDPCATQCAPPYNQVESFMGQAATDSSVNHTTVAIADGALGGQTLDTWDPTTRYGYENYNRVKEKVLAPQGLTEAQVQSVWVKDTDEQPTTSLPSSRADAYTAEGYLGDVVRAILTRYPNVQQVFVSSRIYAGYALTCLDPEPYSYETAFSVKWLVQAQINQVNSGGQPDPIAGNLNYSQSKGRVVAPWIAWGPYLWASGANPRSDNLVWCNGQHGGLCDGEIDYRLQDRTHPSTSGEQKVGTMLLDFMKTSPYTGWFLTGQ